MNKIISQKYDRGNLQQRNLIKITLNLEGNFKFNTSKVRKAERSYIFGEGSERRKEIKKEF